MPDFLTDNKVGCKHGSGEDCKQVSEERMRCDCWMQMIKHAKKDASSERKENTGDGDGRKRLLLEEHLISEEENWMNSNENARRSHTGILYGIGP